ncbi:hypothetical protein [Saccharolobus caldissimus]|uniref:Uncharacterized protein n=1 Tax=Saccharolobus caldissimus TaxID=1702097 RepID=A0AAQ4CPK7_9CREN|nr:hypothetical protein [Saccharolobus caldissimus]BDB97738.1 hypothetical protein SACC_07550 [Saccharolobus caldissimus]
MGKRIEILIVEDYSGKVKINEQDVKKSLTNLTDDVVITKIHVPQWISNEEESGILGVHVIVREIAET